MLSRWWCWCLQLLLITKHLSLLPNRMSSTMICVGGGGDKYDNKIFFSNLDNCVCAQVPAEPSLHWERMQGFQTQKWLYNCRCLSVIITFFKIFSRKNDSTFVNVCPSSSLSSKSIILINWKKFSSHLSVFLDAIKGRLQKKEGRWRSHEKNHVLIYGNFQTFILWMR